MAPARVTCEDCGWEGSEADLEAQTCPNCHGDYIFLSQRLDDDDETC